MPKKNKCYDKNCGHQLSVEPNLSNYGKHFLSTDIELTVDKGAYLT